MAKFKGDNFNNMLVGTAGRDLIKGRGGDDVLDGLNGNDRIFGGDGNDTIFGGGGKDKVNGGRGNDTIFGDAGNDDLKGKSGDDKIDGGAGNDKIDGGRGVDTAVYHGDYADFAVTGSGHGGKLTVAGTTPATLAANGVDKLKDIEFLQFDDAVINVSTGDSWHYSVNAAVDVSAQDPVSPGNLYAGNGIPATGFGVARNEGAGVELGLQVIYRQGPTVTTTDDYADGVLHYAVNDGAQSMANDSFANNPLRAAWSFEYSIATGLNGETTDLDNFTFKLLIDTDPTAAVSYVTLELEPELTPQAAGQSGFQWRDQDSNLVPIADDEGTANVTQNSQNYAFYGIPGYNVGNGFAGPAYFDIQLQAYDGAQLIAQNHISVDVIL
jgi:hypothetical protein